jgi:preprotein translocase subunit SecG
MYYLVVGIYVIICFLLLVVVLLQQGKGGDIAAAFGGSSSQTAFGARAGATVLTRATAILGTLFMLGAFGLALMSRSGGGGSVVSGIAAPAPDPGTALPGGSLPGAPPAASPATPPATPPPATTPPPVEKGKGGK